MAKIQPAVQTIRFTIPVSANPSYIDLGMASSIVNRRFMRQGMNYAVAGLQVIAPPTTSGTVKFSKIPNTWVASNAWHKMMAAWMRQQNEALAEGQLQSTKGAFNDFKIFADSDHVQKAAPQSLLPIDADGNTYSSFEEWLHSQVAFPNDDSTPGNTTERALHMVGTHISGVSISLIKAYQESRAVPQSPDPATPGGISTSPYMKMFDVGSDDETVLENATNRNDQLPYNQMHYPGGDTNAPTLEVHDQLYLNPASTIPGKYNLAGTNLPCGLLRVDSSADNALTLVFRMVPGKTRGYMAEPMQDM